MENKSILVTFGEKLRQLRREKGLTQEAFADLCGLDRTYISGLERGKRNPSLNAIHCMAEALEVSAGHFFCMS